MAKKYYWLKLHEGFFDTNEIKALEDMENGGEYVMLWLKLLLKSLKFTREQNTMGLLKFNDLIPWSPELMASSFNVSKEIATGAVTMFVKLGMVTVTESGEMWANEIEEMIGSESDSTERVRKHRAKMKQLQIPLQCNSDVTKCNTEKRREDQIIEDQIIEDKKREEKDNWFEIFWKEYPRKVAKIKAKTSWDKIEMDKSVFEKIMQGLRDYKTSDQWEKDDGEFIPHPTTWLNQQRWNDEFETGYGDEVVIPE